MKKLILTFAIVALSVAGFSQTFSYEPKKVELAGSPSWSADSLEITYPYDVIVGIVGEPYGFIPPAANKNVFRFTLSTKEARSPEVLQKYAWSKAYDWVRENYPDVK